MSEFLIGGKFAIEIADRTAENPEQLEAAIQEHFQRIVDLVMGRTLHLSNPMPQGCRKPLEFMETAVFSEGRFAEHFLVDLNSHRVIVQSLDAAEFVLFSSMLMEHAEIVNFLKAQRL